VKGVDTSVLADAHRISVLPLISVDNANSHTEVFGYLCEPHHEIASVSSGRSLQLWKRLTFRLRDIEDGCRPPE